MLIGPVCPCPMCEEPPAERTCYQCDGTGQEPALLDTPSLEGLNLGHMLEMPLISVTRGGIVFPD